MKLLRFLGLLPYHVLAVLFFVLLTIFVCGINIAAIFAGHVSEPPEKFFAPRGLH